MAHSLLTGHWPARTRLFRPETLKDNNRGGFKDMPANDEALDAKPRIVFAYLARDHLSYHSFTPAAGRVKMTETGST